MCLQLSFKEDSIYAILTHKNKFPEFLLKTGITLIATLVKYNTKTNMTFKTSCDLMHLCWFYLYVLNDPEVSTSLLFLLLLKDIPLFC